MQYRKYKHPKKAKLKIYKKYEEIIYSVICPRCHTEFVGGIGERTLMFECVQCGNQIDLRDKNGKRAYE
jgi:hypothetical protein